MKKAGPHMTAIVALCGLLVFGCGEDAPSPVVPEPPPRFAVWRVPDSLATIQEAIDRAADGDTVLISPGLYEGPGNRDLVVRAKAVALIGAAGPDSCVVDAGGREVDEHWCLKLFWCGTREALIRGLTFRNAYHLNGPGKAGIAVRDSRVRIEDCLIERNIGGGIALDVPSAQMIGCVIRENTSWTGGPGGGVSCYGGDVLMEDCVVAGNQSVIGAGIWAGSASLTLRGVEICENVAEEYSGGLDCERATVSCFRCTICNNAAWDVGGGIGVQLSAVRLEHCTVAGNAGEGIEFLGSGFVLATRSILQRNCGWDCYVALDSAIIFDSCAIDSTRIFSDFPDQVRRTGAMVYGPAGFCAFRGCGPGRRGDYRLVADSPCRLPGGVVLGAYSDVCP